MAELLLSKAVQFSKLRESQTSKQLLDYIVLGKDYTCDIYHMHQQCNHRQGQKMLNVIKALLKINVPIHVIPLLIYKLKALKAQ